MHLTLKMETTRPPGSISLQQQDRFDAFVHEFNTERPHEALGMKCPAQLYTASPRRYDGLPELTYPLTYPTVMIPAFGVPSSILLHLLSRCTCPFPKIISGRSDDVTRTGLVW